MTTTTTIHDTDTCLCDLCRWADRQERAEMALTTTVNAPIVTDDTPPDPFDEALRLAPSGYQSTALYAILFDVIDSSEWKFTDSDDDEQLRHRSLFVDAVITRFNPRLFAHWYWLAGKQEGFKGGDRAT